MPSGRKDALLPEGNAIEIICLTPKLVRYRSTLTIDHRSEKTLAVANRSKFLPRVYQRVHGGARVLGSEVAAAETFSRLWTSSTKESHTGLRLTLRQRSRGHGSRIYAIQERASMWRGTVGEKHS